jgi:hypothetical protein
VFEKIRAGQRVDNTMILCKSMENMISQFENTTGGTTLPLTGGDSTTFTAADVTAQTANALLTAGGPTVFKNACRFDVVLVGAGLAKTEFHPAMGISDTKPNGWVVGTTGEVIWDQATRQFNVVGGSAAPDYSNVSRLVCQRSTANVPSTAAGSNFLLPENNFANIPSTARVVSAVIKGCKPADAYNLAKKYNETLLDSAAPGSAQNRGRVVFGAPNAVTGTVDTYVYITAL